jgi:hypothetical protein
VSRVTIRYECRFEVDDRVLSSLHARAFGGGSGEARAAGCNWLHVDFEPHLSAFHLDGCGFRATPAGLIDLGVK